MTTSLIKAAILEPQPLRDGRYEFVFSNIAVSVDKDFVFARLSKYEPLGEVEVVHPAERQTDVEPISNLLIASSPFVYIPEHQAIAFQRVWSKIEASKFRKAFEGLVAARSGDFFAECRLVPISSLTSFVERIARVTRFTRIDAKASPPNPLYGPLWKELSEYLRRRNAGEVRVAERAATSEGIRTELARVANAISADSEGPKAEELLSQPLGVTDAALFMAADGYGEARVDGVKPDGSTVTVRTSDVHMEFQHAKDPDPAGLHAAAVEVLRRIEVSRRLQHDDQEG